VTREALEDIEFEDLHIPAGTVLHLFSASAGTDPRAYPNPAFDLTVEERRRHFGFGGGAHHCIGHFVARGDMGEALALLASRLADIRISAGDVAAAHRQHRADHAALRFAPVDLQTSLPGLKSP